VQFLFVAGLDENNPEREIYRVDDLRLRATEALKSFVLCSEIGNSIDGIIILLSRGTMDFFLRGKYL